MNKILFYEKENGENPVKEFLNTLPFKHKTKALWEIDLLKQFGRQLKEPYVKKIKGERYKDLWELRIQFSSDISRILYFTKKEDTFVLLHGFLKKTDKTPVNELEIANKYKEDCLKWGLI
jgi:phage-related protein